MQKWVILSPKQQRHESLTVLEKADQLDIKNNFLDLVIDTPIHCWLNEFYNIIEDFEK